MHSPVSPLLGTTLVIAAHPDDEIACVTILKRARRPIVVFATEGAPEHEFFWYEHGSRDAYRALRRSEATSGLARVGVSAIEFLADTTVIPLEDQQLHRAIPVLVDRVLASILVHRPDALLVPAYEGGHPDHDVCSFVGFVLSRLQGIPAWEMPLYHRSTTGTLVSQKFLDPGKETLVPLTGQELESRRILLEAYASQRDLSKFAIATAEAFRPQRAYDYSRPPQDSASNYESWGWSIKARELCGRFRELGSGLLNARADRFDSTRSPAV